MKKVPAIRVPSAKGKLLKRAPKTKNVTNDAVEGKLGRIYVPDQEIGKICLTGGLKGLKRERRDAKKNRKRSKKKEKANPE